MSREDVPGRKLLMRSMAAFLVCYLAMLVLMRVA
jgi:hypothetical protein